MLIVMKDGKVKKVKETKLDICPVCNGSSVVSLPLICMVVVFIV